MKFVAECLSQAPRMLRWAEVVPVKVISEEYTP